MNQTILIVANIRQWPGHEATPILVLATKSGDDTENRGRAAGATGWLVKPLNPVRRRMLVK